MGASCRIARAMARRWRCPPDRAPAEAEGEEDELLLLLPPSTPPGPMRVSYPCGRSAMKAAHWAAAAAASTSARDAPGRAYAMFSATVPAKMMGSWGTTATVAAQAAREKDVTGVPPRVMRPPVGAYRRVSRAATVDLPAPDRPTRAVTRPRARVRSRPARTGVAGREG